MIVNNMPANGGSQTPFDSAQGQCEFNFLKRKLDAEDNLIAINSQQINNENGSPAVEVSYQGASNNLWKKRHLEDTTNINHATSCFGINSFISSNPLNDFHSTAGGNGNAGDSAHNNNNSNSTDLTFNLIGSSFINDLFAYDANLIVPVPASLVSSSSTCGASSVATFSTPASVCVNSTYDDGANWQATDLLELDHRYNSGLNTEITQLNPTVTLKTAEQNNNSQQEQTHQLQQEQQQSATAQTNFLVPQKQVSTRPATIPCPTQSAHAKYNRQLANLSPQTAATQNDTEADFEDKNLSWLLNFKFDELPHLSPDVGGVTNNTNGPTPGAANYNTSPTSSNKSSSSSPSSVAPTTTTTKSTQQMMPHSERSRSPKSSTKAGKKFEELVMEVTANSEMDGNEMVVAEHVIVDDTSAKMSKKPPFTYTELIEYALEDKGELTVSGIYQWISDRFPYYKSNDDRWKNSVRHNLSINPHFRKGAKAPQGAGHLWTISSGDSAENVLAWEHKKQRLDLFFKMESMNRERLLQHQLQQQQQQNCTSPAHHQGCQHDHCLYDEAAAAAAAITQEMLHSTEVTHNCAVPTITTNAENQRLTSTHSSLNELPFNDLMSDEELRKTAGQILNGIHREVEVQSVNSIISTYHDVLLDNEEYLNPIHKDVAVNESGLRNNHSNHSSNHQSQYYVTEIDPMELGIQMSHQVEEEVLFNDEFNLNYFGYNAGNDIVA